MKRRTDHPADRQARRVLNLSRFIMALVSVAMIGVIGRVIQLQIQPAAPIAVRISDRGSKAPILPRRGNLLDTRGRPLAVTYLGRRLFADPMLIEAPDEFAAHVAHALGDDPARLDQLIGTRAHRRYVVLNPLLDDDQRAAIDTLKLSGLATEARPVRIYPHGSLASQVIGFVGAEHKGLDGVEYALESVLRGDGGAVRMLRDVRRHPLWIERSGYTPPRDGKDVRLSLDLVAQAIAESALAAACEKYEADRGELLVMDARTGQILAMCNWPPFDPANLNAADEKARRNRCITDPYEPGSVFKPFMHAAASAAGLARPQQIIDCESSGVWIAPPRRRLRDAHAHGPITWDQVLIVSSNIGMGKVAMNLGPQRMYDAVQAFGFGQRTGTGLPGESPGIINPVNTWTLYSLTSVPMGQEIAVTPLQLARGLSAFANGGLVVSPSILAGEAESPIYQRAIDSHTADHTRLLMRRVVTEGTGRNAKSDLYRIWGKTGTAQVPDRVRGGYKERAYAGTFICGAPLIDPKIIVTVTIHEPNYKIAYYGGVIAAPTAKTVVEQVLTYLGVPPDAGEDDPTAIPPSVAHASFD